MKRMVTDSSSGSHSSEYHLQRLVVTTNQLQGNYILLTDEQRHYLKRVLRLRQGDRLIVMDGQGHSWLATLMEQDPTQLQAEILAAIEVKTELPVTTTLVIALPKGNGFDDVVRQVTELGVSVIAPVISDRTLLHPSPSRLERWRRIAQESAEQSERQVVPTILDPLPLADYLAQPPPTDPQQTSKFICVTRQPAPHLLKSLLLPNPPLLTPQSSLAIAIGPEGGWTTVEVERAIAASYQPVSLGERILRAITAPVMAMSLIAAICERDSYR